MNFEVSDDVIVLSENGKRQWLRILEISPKKGIVRGKLQDKTEWIGSYSDLTQPSLSEVQGRANKKFPSKMLENAKSAAFFFAGSFNGTADLIHAHDANIPNVMVHDSSQRKLSLLEQTYPIEWDYRYSDLLSQLRRLVVLRRQFDIVVCNPFPSQLAPVMNTAMKYLIAVAGKKLIIAVNGKELKIHGLGVVSSEEVGALFTKLGEIEVTCTSILKRSDNYEGMYWLVLEKTSQPSSTELQKGLNIQSGDQDVPFHYPGNFKPQTLSATTHRPSHPEPLAFAEFDDSASVPSPFKGYKRDVIDLEMDGRSKISSYHSLLSNVLQVGAPSMTLEAASKLQNSNDPYFCLRHDVDHSLEQAVKMARIEHLLGIKATYYMLPPGDYNRDYNYYGKLIDGRVHHSRALAEGCQEIISLGHEIGLHNDFLQLSVKLGQPIHDVIKDEIAYFARIGITVSGSASHGSEFIRSITDDGANYEIFSDCNREPNSTILNLGNGEQFKTYSIKMADVGLSYEAYDLDRIIYASDTGSSFAAFFFEAGGQPFSTLNPEAVRYLFSRGHRIMLLIHPEWWTDRTSNEALLARCGEYSINP